MNEYLREITGEDFTAKDFRTWAGTVLAAQLLRDFAGFDSEAQAKKNIVRAIEAVAKRLGNTKAVCRKCYIHPAVLDSYLDGSMLATVAQRARRVAQSAGRADGGRGRGAGAAAAPPGAGDAPRASELTVQRLLILIPPLVPSILIGGPPPFSRASRLRRLDSVFSSCRPSASMPPLVMLAEMVGRGVGRQPQLDAAIGASELDATVRHGGQFDIHAAVGRGRLDRARRRRVRRCRRWSFPHRSFRSAARSRCRR